MCEWSGNHEIKISEKHCEKKFLIVLTVLEN